MLADLESDLGSLLDHSGRVALLTEVLRVLSTEARLTADGSLDSLLTSPPSSPPTDGVSERGGPVAEIAGLLDAGEIYAGVATPARTALSLYVGHEDWAPGLSDSRMNTVSTPSHDWSDWVSSPRGSATPTRTARVRMASDQLRPRGARVVRGCRGGLGLRDGGRAVESDKVLAARRLLRSSH